MIDSIASILSAFEGLSSIVVLCVLIVWFTRQVILAMGEKKTTTNDLAENTIKLLTQEQEKNTELNDRVDHLYSENRILRSEIHDLKQSYDDLHARYESAITRIESLETQLNQKRRDEGN